MEELFEIAGGTIIGREHKQTDKNNQDAFRWIMTGDFLAAVVCDGCSGGIHSEVGAHLAVRFITAEIRRLFGRLGNDPFRLLKRVRKNLLAQLLVLANTLGPSLSQIVDDHLLFTVVGALITHTITCIFSIGDGVAVLNGYPQRLGPFPDNKPPYLAYDITGSQLTQDDPELLEFAYPVIADTASVRSLVIGTDGVLDLMNAALKPIPGKAQPVGPISQFWDEDKYFANPDMIRRRLCLANRDAVKYLRDEKNNIVDVKKENGLLPDDTSLIVIRRRRR